MSERPKLDETDIAILATLQGNGRMTNVVLAESVGLSASPCLQRLELRRQRDVLPETVLALIGLALHMAFDLIAAEQIDDGRPEIGKRFG